MNVSIDESNLFSIDKQINNNNKFKIDNVPIYDDFIEWENIDKSDLSGLFEDVLQLSSEIQIINSNSIIRKHIPISSKYKIKKMKESELKNVITEIERRLREYGSLKNVDMVSVTPLASRTVKVLRNLGANKLANTINQKFSLNKYSVIFEFADQAENLSKINLSTLPYSHKDLKQLAGSVKENSSQLTEEYLIKLELVSVALLNHYATNESNGKTYSFNYLKEIHLAVTQEIKNRDNKKVNAAYEQSPALKEANNILKSDLEKKIELVSDRETQELLKKFKSKMSLYRTIFASETPSKINSKDLKGYTILGSKKDVVTGAELVAYFNKNDKELIVYVHGVDSKKNNYKMTQDHNDIENSFVHAPVNKAAEALIPELKSLLDDLVKTHGIKVCNNEEFSIQGIGVGLDGAAAQYLLHKLDTESQSMNRSCLMLGSPEYVNQRTSDLMRKTVPAINLKSSTDFYCSSSSFITNKIAFRPYSSSSTDISFVPTDKSVLDIPGHWKRPYYTEAEDVLKGLTILKEVGDQLLILDQETHNIEPKTKIDSFPELVEFAKFADSLMDDEFFIPYTSLKDLREIRNILSKKSLLLSEGDLVKIQLSSLALINRYTTFQPDMNTGISMELMEIFRVSQSLMGNALKSDSVDIENLEIAKGVLDDKITKKMRFLKEEKIQSLLKNSKDHMRLYRIISSSKSTLDNVSECIPGFMYAGSVKDENSGAELVVYYSELENKFVVSVRGVDSPIKNAIVSQNHEVVENGFVHSPVLYATKSLLKGLDSIIAKMEKQTNNKNISIEGFGFGLNGAAVQYLLFRLDSKKITEKSCLMLGSPSYVDGGTADKIENSVPTVNLRSAKDSYAHTGAVAQKVFADREYQSSSVDIEFEPSDTAISKVTGHWENAYKSDAEDIIKGLIFLTNPENTVKLEKSFSEDDDLTLLKSSEVELKQIGQHANDNIIIDNNNNYTEEEISLLETAHFNFENNKKLVNSDPLLQGKIFFDDIFSGCIDVENVGSKGLTEAMMYCGSKAGTPKWHEKICKFAEMLKDADYDRTKVFTKHPKLLKVLSPTLYSLKKEEKRNAALRNDDEHKLKTNLASFELTQKIWAKGITNTSQGLNGAKMVKDAVTGNFIGIFKPTIAPNERNLVEGTWGKGTFGQLANLNYKNNPSCQQDNEVAAYMLSKELGFNNVPCSEKTSYGELKGVFMNRANGEQFSKFRETIEKKHGFSDIEKTRIQKAQIFQFLIGNQDTVVDEDYFVSKDKDGNIVINLIDAGNGFIEKNPKSPSKNMGSDRREKLFDFAMTDDSKSFVEGLSKKSIDSFFRKTTEILGENYWSDNMKDLLLQRFDIIKHAAKEGLPLTELDSVQNSI